MRHASVPPIRVARRVGRSRRAALRTGTLAAAALVAASCGSTTPHAATPTTSSPAPVTVPATSAPSATSATSPTPATSVTSPTTTAPVRASTTSAPSTTVPPPSTTTPTVASDSSVSGGCGAAELSAFVVRSGVAAGSVGQTIALRNTSPRSCTLYGYPGLVMLGPAGQPLPTHVERGSSTTVRPEQPATVLLASGADASFALGFSDGTGFHGGCPASARLEVTAPNAYGAMTLSDRLDAYGPCGAITVSPVYPGTGEQP